MILSQLLKTLTMYQTVNFKEVNITGIEMDSRNVREGDLFICINGFTVDGHQYANEAVGKGAIAIISEKPLDVSVPVIIVKDTSRALSQLANSFYGYPTNKLKLIGVTGTNGKTTVTHLLDEIFQLNHKKTGLIGTIQMKIGSDKYDVKNTTPDALFLQKSFHQMVEQNVDIVNMEVSSHALDLGRVNGCDFDIAVFTNLSQDHLDYHQNMDEYLRAKSLLFSRLGNNYNEDLPKFAVINVDDHYSHVLMKSTSQPIITYGIQEDADVTAENIHLSANGSKFILKTPNQQIEIESKLMGKFSVYNMLAATATAICCGVPLDVIKESLEKTVGVSGRFEPVIKGQSYGVIVDYAHTPDSLENVLTTIQSFVKGKVYTVVGCGGDRDKKKRPLMADIAVNYSDYAVFTSDNPRSEDPNQIISDMVTGLEANNFRAIVDREEAISYAIHLANEDDVVLIAGKGHETYQIIGNQVNDFDDRKVAEKAIMKMLGKE